MSNICGNLFQHIRGGRLTKVNGKVASCAPLSVSIATPVLVANALTLTTVSTLAFLTAVPTPAAAGSCVESPADSGNWICAGAADQTNDTWQSMIGDVGQDMRITITPGLGVDTRVNSPNRPSLRVRSNEGDLVVDGGVNSNISSGGLGVEVRATDGSIDLEWAGDIQSATNGLNIVNVERDSAFRTNLNAVVSGDITAGSNGIFALNQGTGTMDVSVEGDVVSNSSGGYYGLRAQNWGGADSSVNIGASSSITSLNGNGALIAHGRTLGDTTTATQSGSLDVVIDGDVRGETQRGVWIATSTLTTETNVSGTGDIYGGQNGLEVSSLGSGPTNIELSGDITGENESGASLDSAGGGTIQFSSSGRVSGGVDGIVSTGTGQTDITVSGAIRGGSGAGINTNNAPLVGANALTLTSTADIAADSGNAVLDGAGDSVVNVQNGATVNGAIRLGDGSDNLVFATDASGISIFDGGDDSSSSDGAVDQMSLLGQTLATNGTDIVNWEVVTLDASSLTIGDGDWSVGDVTDASTGVFAVNGARLNGGGALNLNSNLSIDAASALQGFGGGIRCVLRPRQSGKSWHRNHPGWSCR